MLRHASVDIARLRLLPSLLHDVRSLAAEMAESGHGDATPPDPQRQKRRQERRSRHGVVQSSNKDLESERWELVVEVEHKQYREHRDKQMCCESTKTRQLLDD